MQRCRGPVEQALSDAELTSEDQETKAAANMPIVNMTCVPTRGIVKTSGLTRAVCRNRDFVKSVVEFL